MCAFLWVQHWREKTADLGLVSIPHFSLMQPSILLLSWCCRWVGQHTTYLCTFLSTCEAGWSLVVFLQQHVLDPLLLCFFQRNGWHLSSKRTITSSSCWWDWYVLLSPCALEDAHPRQMYTNPSAEWKLAQVPWDNHRFRVHRSILLFHTTFLWLGTVISPSASFGLLYILQTCIGEFST